MINKQSILLLTLFSLILVLSVYYITMPSEFDVSASNVIPKFKIFRITSHSKILAIILCIHTIIFRYS